MNRVLFITLMGLSMNSWAARSVTLAIPSTGGQPIVINNPSAVAVSFDLECYDSAGMTSYTSAGESLAAKASKNFTPTVSVNPTGVCAGGANADSSNSFYIGGANGAWYACPGANTYASATNACGTGQSLCSLDSGFCSYSVPVADYWVGGASTWDSSTDYFTTSTPETTNKPMLRSSNVSSDQCRPSGGGAALNYCSGAAPATTAGAICCKYPSAMCKVTITTTNSAAHLSSPQFKGGAPF